MYTKTSLPFCSFRAFVGKRTYLCSGSILLLASPTLSSVEASEEGPSLFFFFFLLFLCKSRLAGRSPKSGFSSSDCEACVSSEDPIASSRRMLRRWLSSPMKTPFDASDENPMKTTFPSRRMARYRSIGVELDVSE